MSSLAHRLVLHIIWVSERGGRDKEIFLLFPFWKQNSKYSFAFFTDLEQSKQNPLKRCFSGGGGLFVFLFCLDHLQGAVPMKNLLVRMGPSLISVTIGMLLCTQYLHSFQGNHSTLMVLK